MEREIRMINWMCLACILKELGFHSRVATMLEAKKKKKSSHLVLCLFYLFKELGLMILIFKVYFKL